MSGYRFQDRYDRNFDTLSESDQKKLGQSNVLVIGLGGLGGSVCEMLARIGVGHLTVADGDVFDVSNLNRQVLSQEKLIGRSKAVAAKERLQAVNSDIKVTVRDEMLDASNLYENLKGQDVVMDCLDSIGMRFTLQDAAEKAGVPIVSGAIAGVSGQVTTIFPGDAGYALIYGSEKNRPEKGAEEDAGNLSFCAGFVAALQACECVKVLLKKNTVLQNKLLIAEMWSNTYTVVDLI